METVISLKDVGKQYRIYAGNRDRLKEFLSPGGKKYSSEFWALKNITLDIYKGEAFGIIGRNGSGKSTLLQLICGIIKATEGQINIGGRIYAMLELGASFNMEYSGRANIRFHGALMGYTPAEIENRMETIENYADIGDFIDQPMKTYSSGMFMRVAFACAVNMEPDIMVVDEALGVGDIFFQQKCFRTIEEIISKGTTCLFVSHDLEAIRRLCSRVLVLDDGQNSFVGPAVEAVNRYASSLKTRRPSHNPVSSQPSIESDGLMSAEEILNHNIISVSVSRYGAGGLRVLAARITDKHSCDCMMVKTMESLTFHVLLEGFDQVYDPTVALSIFDRFNNCVFAAGSRQLSKRLPDISPNQKLIVRFDLTMSIGNGEYTFGITVSERAAEDDKTNFSHDVITGLGPVIVYLEEEDNLPFYGIAYLPMKFGYRSYE